MGLASIRLTALVMGTRMRATIGCRMDARLIPTEELPVRAVGIVLCYDRGRIIVRYDYIYVPHILTSHLSSLGCTHERGQEC
jgi:hypothetical protein